tara:strand:- start:416 stop:541 length:126 start_codon:yes stop_codon:yes gene_type:complete
VIASCITGISAIHGGHERHVKGDAPEVPALSAAGVAKPDKA